MWWHNKDGLKPGDFTEEGERVYQAIKKRLMDELFVGFENDHATKLIYGDGMLILLDKETKGKT